MPKVYKKTGARAGESFFIRKNAVTLGRAMQCDFLFNDAGISRNHARIEYTPQGYLIKDLGSGNGTYVQGVRIEKDTLLRDQDEFALGSILFMFFYNDDAIPEQIEDFTPPPLLLPAGPREDTMVKQVPHTDRMALKPLVTLESSGETDSQLLKRTITKPLKGVGKAYYASDELQFASIISGDMGEVIGLRRQKRDLQMADKYAIMFKISQTIAESNDLDALVSHSLELIMRIFPATRAYFFMKDEMSGNLVPFQTFPPKLIEENPLYSRNILNEIIRKKVAIMTQDAVHDGQFASNQSIVMAKIRSAMVAPLLVEDTLIGALQIDSQVNDAFNGDDMDLFAAIANQLAVGVNSKILMQMLNKEIDARKKVSRFHSPAVLRALMECSGDAGLEPEKKFCSIFFLILKGLPHFQNGYNLKKSQNSSTNILRSCIISLLNMKEP
jgi:pSer/pThr/pTyr-binding forkhead associated (FHA) protein/putative methionine-R-sulfoxide reductase with GAF domain